MVERKKTNRAKARKGVSALLSLSLLVLADETSSIVHLGQALVCCYYIPHMHGDFLSLYPRQHYSASLFMIFGPFVSRSRNVMQYKLLIVKETVILERLNCNKKREK